MLAFVSKGRLTRQELGWLLTQEASGAAERLRLGVQVLKSNPPPQDASPEGLDATLDALDDAMKMLSGLHHKPSKFGARRGRIDLAALLWEVAPDARVSIEPGSGTEVFGDEAELRRMLQLLVMHGQGSEGAINIKREGDDVKVGVVLGPDSSSSASTERAWLSRMATRYGGKLELEGGMELVSLPADGVSEKKEREALQKELVEARKQGEAYARELAEAFSPHEESVSPSTFPPPLGGSESHDRFAVLTRLASGVAGELRSALAPAMRELHGTTDDPTDTRAQAIRRAVTQAHDLSVTLSQVGTLDCNEIPGPVDVSELAATHVKTHLARAEKNGVTLKCTPAGSPAIARVAPRAAGLLLDQLLSQAIASSPRGSEIHVEILDEEVGPRIMVDDSGPPLPLAARRAFAALEIEPGTYGRPTNLPIYVAAEVSAWQGATFELSDSPRGGLRVAITFRR